MWIHYDFKYDIVKTGEIITQIEVGLINTHKIISMEVTATSLYIYLAENYHIRFEHTTPIVIFSAFKDCIREEKLQLIEGIGSIDAF